jgi:ribosome-binding protein aMBF1 (putative translation factor)
MEIGEVEAIEEGKIVKVTEDYAVREGLPIIRRQNFHEISNLGEGEKKRLEIEKLGFDELRKPLNWREKQKVRGLVDNFHWHISRRRREMGLNRGQVAEKVGESEEVIKAMENGIIPNEDIGLISKMEDFLGISLRKGADEFIQNMRALIENAQKEKVTNLK